MIKAADGQCGENSDTLTEHPIGILESQGDFGGRTFRLGRIGHALVRRHRLTGPHWTRFTRPIVANGKNEIEDRGPRFGKLIPRFRSQARGVMAEALQELDGVWVHPPVWLTARAL